MAKTKSPKSAAPPALPQATNPEAVKSVYVNNMEFLLNGLEARLFFNEIIAGLSGPLSVERRAIIVMALPHFVAMAQVFQTQLPKALEIMKAQESAMATSTKNAAEA